MFHSLLRNGRRATNNFQDFLFIWILSLNMVDLYWSPVEFPWWPWEGQLPRGNSPGDLYCNLCQTKKKGLTFHEILGLLKWSACFFCPPKLENIFENHQTIYNYTWSQGSTSSHTPTTGRVFFWCKHQPWICDSSMFGTPLRWWWEMLVYHGRSHTKITFLKIKAN